MFGGKLNRFWRCNVEGHDGNALVGGIQDLHAGIIGDNDLADEPVAFFHQHQIHSGVFLVADADLSAADTDGGYRCRYCHRIRIGLGNLTAHKSENAG